MRFILQSSIVLLIISVISISCNNKVQSPAEAPKLAEACLLKPESGPCKGAFNYYYYDKTKKKCATFIYGGCQGVVPFKTLEECQEGCNCE